MFPVEELDQMVEKLEFIASLDGIISEDEKLLLKTVKKNVYEFKKMYSLSLEEGGVITNHEKKELRRLWNKILIDSSKQAFEDDKYSPDDLRMIFNIFSVIIKKFDLSTS